MPIDLGLSRITRLLQSLGNPHKISFKSIHVAGTNGKGSSIALLSSVLTSSNIRNGRFTSPHLVSYHDCILIDNNVYPLTKFERVMKLVNERDEELKLGCTEFELMTAAAFKIFELEKVELALIEVGLGGRLDATNVLEPHGVDGVQGGVVISAITKIGMDHENFLGDTIAKIAGEKAGIIKEGRPCVVDASNEESVLEVIRKQAEDKKSELILAKENSKYCMPNGFISTPRELRPLNPLKGEYQVQNLSVCIGILSLLRTNSDTLSESSRSRINEESIKRGLSDVSWEGRLSNVAIPNSDLNILIDGAHNESAAIALANYLDSLPSRSNGLVFIVGMTKGKPIEKLLKHVLRENDKLVPAVFSTPENMPWVSCCNPKNIADIARSCIDDVVTDIDHPTVEKVIKYLAESKGKGDSRQIVLCGSLYLCSDLLRYVRGDRL